MSVGGAFLVGFLIVGLIAVLQGVTEWIDKRQGRK